MASLLEILLGLQFDFHFKEKSQHKEVQKLKISGYKTSLDESTEIEVNNNEFHVSGNPGRHQWLQSA